MKSARIVPYELAEAETPTTIKLKRWSTAKLFALLQCISELLSKVDFDAKKMETDRMVEISRVIAQASSAAQAQLTFIIKESVDGTLTDEQILEWTPEDYVGVLAKIFAMNITEGLLKNLSSLRAAILPQKT